MTFSTIPATTSLNSVTPNTGSSNSINSTAGPSSSSGSGNSQSNFNNQIAGNFNQFLSLLTTQLQNQDPLSPMDSNQFTQQLVQFASVEQQINMNTNLQTLVSLQQTAQDTQALGFVGQTVTVSGATATLANGQAQWTYNAPSQAVGTVTITNSSGQTVFSQTGMVQPGGQPFTWNGIGNDGMPNPPGDYTISITTTGANGQSVAVPTNVVGVVNSVDLTHNPPLLSINGKNYTMNQILSVTQGSSTPNLSSLTNTLNSVSGQLGTLTSKLSTLL
jgi:flagellar basal-body rod modification protein FlgD